MSTPPADRKYAESHEWHKLDGDTLTIGISAFAVDQLTDLTFIEMKEPGTHLSPGDVAGEVESVKTTSDVYCFAEGDVIEANAALADNPGLVNEDPYEKGWLVKVKVTDPSGLDALMDADTYAAEHTA
ncbi:MAG: glycine cleavage system protein GcvH [Phycisphaeraceae bacterium]|nr:MAG: glycine cleavage system protein GcvH [Phycisphaeraceae bacterium]